jgi:uncharacterized protein (UPF0548 family)
MFLPTAPSAEKIRKFIAAQQGLAFSYSDVGATRRIIPPGYTRDHNRVKLGVGRETYEHAVAALRNWKHFELGWVNIVPPGTTVEVGATVAVLVHHFGLWSLNACRIVYVFDEERRFGFAYGTLPDHAERGEERFTIEWYANDDSVWYDIVAFSQPAHLLARAGYPLTRQLQKRFARDSLCAMQKSATSE